VGAIADAAQAADAFFLVNADDAALVAVDGMGSTHIDALAALGAVGGNESIVVIENAYRRIITVVGFEIGFRASLFAFQATGANLLTYGKKFHGVNAFLIDCS